MGYSSIEEILGYVMAQKLYNNILNEVNISSYEFADGMSNFFWMYGRQYYRFF